MDLTNAGKTFATQIRLPRVSDLNPGLDTVGVIIPAIDNGKSTFNKPFV